MVSESFCSKEFNIYTAKLSVLYDLDNIKKINAFNPNTVHLSEKRTVLLTTNHTKGTKNDFIQKNE